MLTISYDDYRDRVLAGWLGKSVGGVIGAPLENQKCYHDLTMDNLWPDKVGANDDLDIQVVWLEAMQERGLYLTSHDLAEFWQDRCWYNFCEYGVFLNNYQRGIAPPTSGTWNNNFFWESEGCPIRSEIWGFVAPGNPSLAADLATLDGQLDHGGASVQTERFLSAAAAHAMVCDDLDTILKVATSVIPTDCEVARAVDVVRRICDRYSDPRQAWRKVVARYGDRDASKAITNHAIVLMSLFLSKGDFRRAMLICANSGWDTDCTAATAGALLGAMHGTSCLPPDWVEKLGKNLICGIAVKHKNAPLVDFAEDTCRIGVEMAAQRNKAVRFTGAPDVAVRPAPAPAVRVEAAYPAGPVLWSSRPTPVRLLVTNPTAAAQSGRLETTPLASVVCEPAAAAMEVPAGGKAEAVVTIRRADAKAAWLADKNIFEAKFSAKGSSAARTFGLGGARQWMVYGPYWEMWDKARNAVCPYYNDTVRCHPGAVGYGVDSYNQYVRLDEPYLDEARLLREDIPDELPEPLEQGEDLITDRHLGGFKGEACYYFVRTFRTVGQSPVDAQLYIGHSGPFRAWLDGQEIASNREIRDWDAFGLPSAKVQLTHRPHRLVVKFVRLADAMGLSVTFMGGGDPQHKHGISWLHDCLEDSVVGEPDIQ